METTQVITITTYLLFIYLILALFVERSVEIIVSIFNYADLKLGGYATWNRKARKYQKRFDRLYSYKGSDSSQVDRILNWVLWRIVTDKPHPGGKDVILASSVRLNFVRLMSRITAFLISLVFVIIIYAKLNVDLVSVMGNIVGDSKILGLLENHAVLKIVIYIRFLKWLN